MVTVYVPADKVLVPVNVTVVVGEPVVSGFVPNTTDVPTGFPPADNVMLLENPPLKLATRVVCMEAGAGQVAGAGAGAPMVKFCNDEVIVKSALLMSKKILPTDSIFILAVVVATFGIVTVSVPSFGVLAESTVGKVVPPSVDKDIFTLAQLTGAPVVPATFHVMVWEEPPIHVTFVLGDVTRNGPEVLLTVITMSVKLV
jgi:hypothetical protein